MPRGNFFKNVLTMATGNAAGLAAMILVTPILTRILTPADFGVHATYVAIVSILGIVSTLSYELAIPLARDDNEAAGLLYIAILWAFIVALFVYVVLTIQPRLDLLNFEILYSPALLLFGIFVTGFNQSLIQVAIRTHAFDAVAKARTLHGLTTAVMNILLGFLGWGYMGLIFSSLAGWLTLNTTLVMDHRVHSLMKKMTFCDARKKIISLMGEYRKFPLLNAPANLMNRATIQTPPLLLASIYGADIAGHYSLIQRVLGTPLTFIGRAIAQVSLGNLGIKIRENQKASNPYKIYDFFSILSQKLFLLSSGVFLIGIIAGIASIYLFGNQWAMAGLIALLLSPAFAVQFAAVPLSQFLIALKKQEYLLVADFLALSLFSFVFVFSYMEGIDSVRAISMLAASMLISNTTLIILSAKVAREHGR